MKILKTIHNDEIILDDEDYSYYSKWSWGINNSGYARRTIRVKGNLGKYKTLFLHKVITNTSKNEIIDHINGNKLDNRKENLRICTQAQNIQRKPSIRTVNSKLNGIYGIDYDNKQITTPYGVRIPFNGFRYSFGYFASIEEATYVYDLAAYFFYGKYAKLNNNVYLNNSEILIILIAYTKNRLNKTSVNGLIKKSIEKQLNKLTNSKSHAIIKK